MACGCLTVSGCAVNPATGRNNLMGLSSINDDIRTGSRAYPEVIASLGGAYGNDRLASYITSLGRKIAATSELPDLPYEFTVINAQNINAFALPGGKIGVTRGLLALASNEAEVAGVLAHEIGHANARHSAQSRSRAGLANFGLAILGAATGSSALVDLGQSVAGTFLQSYSREQEFEADSLAVRYLARTRYDPSAMATMLASMREEEQISAAMRGLPAGTTDQFNIMASHPRTVERVREAMAAAGGAPIENPTVGRSEYLQAINGLLFADDPDQGLVRGRKFVHAGLRFSFEVPEGFRISNQSQNVVAKGPGDTTIVFDMAPVTRARNLVEYLQYEWVRDIPLQGLESLRVNGIAAATGAARIEDGQREIDLRAVAYDGGQGRVFRFLFLAIPQTTRALSGALRETTYSFRRIDDAEARETKPLRIIIADVRAGDTVDALARSLPFGKYNSDWFRVLNDMPPGQEVRVGQTVKIVTA